MKNKAQQQMNASKAIVVWRRCLVIVCLGMVMFFASNYIKKSYVLYTDNSKQIAEKRVDEIGFPLRWLISAEKATTYESELHSEKLILNLLFWLGLSALLNVWWNSDENTGH